MIGGNRSRMSLVTVRRHMKMQRSEKREICWQSTWAKLENRSTSSTSRTSTFWTRLTRYESHASSLPKSPLVTSERSNSSKPRWRTATVNKVNPLQTWAGSTRSCSCSRQAGWPRTKMTNHTTIQVDLWPSYPKSNWVTQQEGANSIST